VPLYEYEGTGPSVAADAFVAPTATLIGDVTIESRASVWFGAVLRGDQGSIVVRAGANIQDNSVLHPARGESLTIGSNATVGHGCVVHGRTVGQGALIGNGSVLLNKVDIGVGAVVAAGAVVTAGTSVPDDAIVVGAPATVRRRVTGSSTEELVRGNGPYYQELAARHMSSLRRFDPVESDQG
jgi:carbonic anhydrase/acetyltransferase-like protein (isoleucine patch superfamily)